MKSFFVPLFLKTGKLAEEKLLVALIGVTPACIYFHYSVKRIDFCSKLKGNVFVHAAKKILDQIESKVNLTNQQLSGLPNALFDSSLVFNHDYFLYLQKYSQNTVVFGEPESFDFQGSDIGFAGLYESLLSEKLDEKKEVKPSLQAKVKHKLETAPIQDKVDIDFKISPEQLMGINSGITVSLIGKNGGFLVANTLDFQHSTQTIVQTLNAFDVLMFSLDKLGTSKGFGKSNYKLIASLPEAGTEQEKLFNLVYANKKGVLDIIPEDSIEVLTSLVEKSNYQKFSSLVL